MSLLSWVAPCWESGLTAEATSLFLVRFVTAWSIAFAYFWSVSTPLDACSTIGLVPLAWAGKECVSASVARWLSVPGSDRLSLVLSPSPCEIATSATVTTNHTATTISLRFTQNCARPYSTPVI